MEFDGAGVIYQRYKSTTTHSDPVPPCDIIWQEWQGVWYRYGITFL